MSYTPGLTDTELRATPVPVSGTVTIQDGGNVISVDDAGGSITVDGTVAATQSGTWTVQPGNTANTTAWKVDASSVAVPVTDNGGNLSIDDGGNSITVDGPLTDAQLRASAVPISAAALPLPSGAATESTLTGVLTTSDFDTKTGSLTEAAPATDTASSGLNGRLQRIAQRITSLIALVPAALTGSGNFKVSLAESTASQAVTNANLDAGLSTLLTTSDFDTKTGSLTESAPATDTASSGLNGRLQRIAQRLTSLIALVPSALTGSGNFKVSLAESTASQAVTGPLTDTQLRATPVPVSGTVTITDGSGPVTVDGTVAVSSITTAVVPGVAATNLGKAEDAQHASGDTGVMTLGVRNDTRASLAGTDGDYVPPQFNSSGDMRVEAFSLGEAGSLGKLEDAAHTTGDAGVPAWTVRNEAASSSYLAGTAGDYQALQSDAFGFLQTSNHRAGSGNITALSQTVTCQLQGCSVVSVNIAGTFVGTLSFQATQGFANTVTLRSNSTGAYLSSTTGVGTFIGACRGATVFTVTATAWTSGTAIISIDADGGTGMVMVSDLNPGVAATSLGKAEDAQHISSDTGVMALGVRNDTRGSLAGTDGDYVPPQMNASGDTRVEAFSLGAAASLGKAEDAAHTSSDVGVMSLTVRNDALNANFLAGTDGDYQPQQSTSQGDLRTRQGEVVVVSATLTRPANTTLYTTNDELTDTGSAILAITGCARYNGGGGTIESITVISSVNAATDPSLDIFIFDTTSTPAADNAAFAPSDGVMATCIFSKSLGTGLNGDTATSGNLLWHFSGPNLGSVPFVCGASSTSLFVRFAVRNGYQPPSNSETYIVRLGIKQY